MSRIYLCVTLACLLCASQTACNSGRDSGEAENKPLSQNSPGIQWESLHDLDELAEQAEEAGGQGDAAALNDLANKIRPIALRVASDTLPTGVHDPNQVQILQQDLRNLAANLPDEHLPIPETDLRQTLKAFHPIVEHLMEAAGMPHVHEHEKEGQDHDHGHAGESQDHDEK